MMQPMTRLSRKELIELIEATEAEGNDATELRNFLAQFPEEGRQRQPARQRGERLVIEDEEPLRDRLNREVGDLFDGGITDELESRCMDMDRDHSTKELQEMCKKAGISPSGHKKKLAAKLIAHNVDSEVEQGVYKVCQGLELCHTVRASSKKEAEDIAKDKGETDAETTQLQDWTARRVS
ncbi:hypothetical protein KKF82_06860 [Patescibacteria group bacterium]|nr:hypothetical protein [Patescibacteria group bacterium]